MNSKKADEKRPTLILWDIDGTLMHCGGDGVKALNSAFETLYGIPEAFAKARIGHAMDGAIVEELMEEFALDPAELHKVKEAYAEALPEILDNNPNKRILPGIVELLEALQRRPEIINGILTSNLRIGAAIKLRTMNLLSYFRFKDYQDLCREKWEEALREIRDQEELNGVVFQKRDIYLVGDTVYDIETAKKLEVKSIAVGTGWASMEALKAAKPDYLLEDFSRTEEVLAILEGENR